MKKELFKLKLEIKKLKVRIEKLEKKGGVKSKKELVVEIFNDLTPEIGDEIESQLLEQRAEQFSISMKTVRKHTKNFMSIYKKGKQWYWERYK